MTPPCTLQPKIDLNHSTNLEATTAKESTPVSPLLNPATLPERQMSAVDAKKELPKNDSQDKAETPIPDEHWMSENDKDSVSNETDNEDEANDVCITPSSKSGNDESKSAEAEPPNGKNSYTYFNPRRICVKMIDYSNVHPLKTFLPLMKQQRAKLKGLSEKEMDKEELIWLDERVDNEKEPDHGILLGLECLSLLLTELKNTGAIKKRTDEEWTEIIQSINCYEKAIKPLTEALKNVENKSKVYE